MIDLRSDTVTKPTPPMWEAMKKSPLGDDVLGDDSTVIELEHKIAEMLGHEAGCFVPSGTMANQIAIHFHTEPGDELILHKDTHVFHYESGAPAAISGVSMNFVNGKNGLFNSNDIKNVIRPEDNHYARSKMVIVENTHNRGGGKVWPISLCEEVVNCSIENKLVTHLDGARLFNASVASNIKLNNFGSIFQSVSVCFSKGLGCPVGSALVSSKKNIKEAKRIRKRLGGTMRQSGLLAGAALWALENNINRLEDDHKRAKQIAVACDSIDGLSVDIKSIDTNIVFINIDSKKCSSTRCCNYLRELGILVLPLGSNAIRAVTHLGIDDEDIDNTIRAFQNIHSIYE